jgi:hypothetical protein
MSARSRPVTEEPTPCIRLSRMRAVPVRLSGVSLGGKSALSNAQNRGRRHDKQGNPWRVYELNHANLISDSLGSLKGIAPEL